MDIDFSMSVDKLYDMICSTHDRLSDDPFNSDDIDKCYDAIMKALKGVQPSDVDFDIVVANLVAAVRINAFKVGFKAAKSLLLG